jgi:hypothetical protein
MGHERITKGVEGTRLQRASRQCADHDALPTAAPVASRLRITTGI